MMSPLTRRRFIKSTGLALGAAAFPALGWNCSIANQKPNILFIMSDDHCTQAIGAYGSRLAKLNPTPNIDRLAKEGMLFENVYCNNSICTPSRASLMTGQYSQTNGVLDLTGSLPPVRHYLPMEMKKLGYQTAMIGKWHLKTEPLHYDYYEVLWGQGAYFDPRFRVKGKGEWPDNFREYSGHSSDVVADISLNWLQTRDKNKPFFLMHHFKAPHDMFDNAKRYDSYLQEIEIPEPENLYLQPNFGSEATIGKNGSLIKRIGTSVSKRHPYRNMGIHMEVDPGLSESEYTHEAYQRYLKRYLRCVKGIDDNMARIFAYLEKNDLMDNTIIIYTADQGMMLGEHDYIDKRWMYEESMRMPFLVRYPNMITPGSRSDLLINNTDFAPTMIQLGGGLVPGYMQGKSFIESLSGKVPADWRKATYYRYWMHLVHHDVPAHFGIRTKEYKLIFYYGRALPGSKGKSLSWLPVSYQIEPTPPARELYDMKNDPHEVNNLYQDPQYTNIIAELKTELKRLRQELNETDKNYPEFQKVIDAHWDD
jgi:arylsulfatase A-like enzyme